MRPQRFSNFPMFVFFVVFVAGCSVNHSLTGKYAAEYHHEGLSHVVSLTLDANGQGSWSGEEENVTFRWDSKGDEIWLHTREGGIITGKVSGTTVLVSLPGAGDLVFRKVEEK